MTPAKKPDDIAQLSLDDLELNTRAYKCLLYAGLVNVPDIIERDENELLLLKNFGRVSLKEVQSALANIGLSLRKGPPKTEFVHLPELESRVTCLERRLTQLETEVAVCLLKSYREES